METEKIEENKEVAQEEEELGNETKTRKKRENGEDKNGGERGSEIYGRGKRERKQ